MYYGIVAFPQKHVQDKVNALRKRYDPHYSLIPPHITLKRNSNFLTTNSRKRFKIWRESPKKSKRFKLNSIKSATFIPPATPSIMPLKMESLWSNCTIKSARCLKASKLPTNTSLISRSGKKWRKMSCMMFTEACE